MINIHVHVIGTAGMIDVFLMLLTHGARQTSSGVGFDTFMYN